MNTHYSIIKLDSKGQPERGMYTSSAAYATPELALRLGSGFAAGHDLHGGSLALAMIELQPHADGEGYRMVRQVILQVIGQDDCPPDSEHTRKADALADRE